MNQKIKYQETESTGEEKGSLHSHTSIAYGNLAWSRESTKNTSSQVIESPHFQHRGTTHPNPSSPGLLLFLPANSCGFVPRTKQPESTSQKQTAKDASVTVPRSCALYTHPSSSDHLLRRERTNMLQDHRQTNSASHINATIELRRTKQSIDPRCSAASCRHV